MKIVIIGGTGFIGSHVTARLLSLGHDLTLFHRDQTQSDVPPTVPQIHGDRQNLLAFREEFEDFSPQIVVDMIPFTEHDASTVMDVFRGVAERVIAISSMDVYRAYGCLIRLESGMPHVGSLTEQSPLRERLYPYRDQAKGTADIRYEYEKILVERAVLQDPELSGTVLRLPKVYGPGDAQHHLFGYLKQMDESSSILLEEGQAQWRWTRGYVENVAEAIALAATHQAAGYRVYNVGDESALPEAEWVRRIGQAASWQGQIKPVPRHVLPDNLALPYDWRHNLAADTSRIRADLGYTEPVAEGDALQRTIAWERAHPPF
jgi:nucleoside-diphosphate-sugar epimerase